MSALGFYFKITNSRVFIIDGKAFDCVKCKKLSVANSSNEKVIFRIRSLSYPYVIKP